MFLFRVLLSFLLISICSTNTLISLDLGTEFMKIGIVKPGVPIDIVLNTETKRKTPMVVYIKDEERLFGDSALSRGMKSPKNAYSHLLDLLGKTVDNPVVKEYQKRFPDHTIEADPIRNTVVFRHDDSTFYSVEELLAMQIEHAVQLARVQGEATVSKAIICVPPFFNQHERQAILSVAAIAQVQVMQLMSTTSAISLQYAVFRNIKMTDKPSIVVFATVGSQFTTAAVVSYSLQKDKITKEEVPTVQVLGVGYDRSLGGYEIVVRLQGYLAEKFTEKYPKLPNIRANKRAMQKLLKESKKVKTVLSANHDTYAQVESLHQDKDFKVKVSRDVLEKLAADLFPRFQAPFEDAITSAGISKEEIEQVVLFGGATRIPKVQEQILAATGKKELHKYMNTDEAAAMGSSFMAASSSSVFKTKDIKLKDANQFPFFVAFNKLVLDGEGVITDTKLVNKELYYRNNGLPQKKAMTYTKFSDDFHFNVSYGNLDFLTEQQISEFGHLPLMTVNVKGVKDVYNQHHDKTAKGIKAHIMVNESGMISVDSVEALFETIVSNKTDPGWLDSVSNFFSGKESDKESDKESEKKEESVKKEEDKGDKKEGEEKKEEVKKDNTTIDTDKKEEKKEIVPEKPVIVREELKIEIVSYGIPHLLDPSLSKDKLAALTKVDDEKRATEEARNKLESYVINMKDLLESEMYISASAPVEMETMRGALSGETDWLEEESWGEVFKVFNERLATLEDICDPVVNRVKEMKNRPSGIADLKQAFNLTEMFLTRIANTSEELRYHTAVEIENLEKLLNETKAWLEKTSGEQETLPKNVEPVLKVETMKTKQTALERELYYLARKPVPQWYKDKLKKMMETLKNTTSTEEMKTKTNETKTEENKTEESEESKSEESKTEENKTEETKSEESKSEETKTEESKTEENKTEESKSEESKSEETKSEESKTEENKTEESKSEESKSEETKSEESKSEEVTPEVSKEKPAEEKPLQIEPEEKKEEL